MGQALQPGDYRAKSIGAQLGKAGTGTEQVAVKFSLLDFPQQTITWFGYFSPNAFDIAMRGLRSAGFVGDDLSDLSSLNEDVSPEVVLVIDNETYQGKTRAKVQFINSTGGVALKDALGDTEAKAFAQRMKGRVVAFDKATGTPPAAKPAPKPAPKKAAPASDEVPLDVLNQQENDHVPADSDDIQF